MTRASRRSGLTRFALDLTLVEFGAEVGGVHLAHGDELAIDGQFEDAGIEAFFPERGVHLAG